MVRFPAAMKMTQPFKGANVFMSRNLVPPEVYNTLLDAFKLNGAEIFLCCDPSRNGPSDFHVIASPDHVRIFLSILTAIEYIYCSLQEICSYSLCILQEKFEDLKAKGCNLIGEIEPFSGLI